LCHVCSHFLKDLLLLWAPKAKSGTAQLPWLSGKWEKGTEAKQGCGPALEKLREGSGRATCPKGAREQTLAAQLGTQPQAQAGLLASQALLSPPRVPAASLSRGVYSLCPHISPSLCWASRTSRQLSAPG